jgi:hypothetical protein
MESAGQLLLRWTAALRYGAVIVGKNLNCRSAVIMGQREYLLRSSRLLEAILLDYKILEGLSYGPPWAHYLGGYQDRLLGGPLGLPDLRCTVPDCVKHKNYRGEVLG